MRRDEARRQALELAVAKARSEAEPMAGVADGSLGGLIELSAQPESTRPTFSETLPGLLRAAAARAPTPVTLGQMKISAAVTGKRGYAQH